MVKKTTKTKTRKTKTRKLGGAANNGPGGNRPPDPRYVDQLLSPPRQRGNRLTNLVRNFMEGLASGTINNEIDINRFVRNNINIGDMSRRARRGIIGFFYNIRDTYLIGVDGVRRTLSRSLRRNHSGVNLNPDEEPNYYHPGAEGVRRQRLELIRKIMQGENVDDGEIADFLEDAISLETIQDPVVAPNGRTYDRPFIEEALMRDARSPVSRAPMTINDLRRDQPTINAMAALERRRVEAQDRPRPPPPIPSPSPPTPSPPTPPPPPPPPIPSPTPSPPPVPNKTLTWANSQTDGPANPEMLRSLSFNKDHPPSEVGRRIFSHHPMYRPSPYRLAPRRIFPPPPPPDVALASAAAAAGRDRTRKIMDKKGKNNNTAEKRRELRAKAAELRAARNKTKKGVKRKRTQNRDEKSGKMHQRFHPRSPIIHLNKSQPNNSNSNSSSNSNGAGSYGGPKPNRSKPNRSKPNRSTKQIYNVDKDLFSNSNSN